ncbi:phage tail sheath family protein [Archangium primigenium]|uniref:phage tail sheath family protein n=1 Tax=[Archangium] primigenium TaxID=2792470 RepID=UPI0019562A07|nr:phage tail sheath subtilisin-like domain-containing protein [Archangium primigenium]MBM7116687.1 phage tail sheath family protein [Archangium primigenium]
MSSTSVPGVSITQVGLESPPQEFSGVPAILGCAENDSARPTPRLLTRPERFTTARGASGPGTALEIAVRGFFENGGRQCWVVPLGQKHTLSAGLAALRDEDAFDLICAPSLPPVDERKGLPAAQHQLLRFCIDRGNCLALLDFPSLGGKSLEQRLLGLRALPFQDTRDTHLGALYFPRIRVAGTPEFFSPCGHIAGLYARTDARHGFSKAPANEVLEGVVDLEDHPMDPAWLHEQGINALRALPGRGIRVMGARTLSPQEAWRSVGVSRLFLLLRRQLMRQLSWATFEPNDWRLWLRVHREVGAVLEVLFQRGALRGASPQDAFYVKCDAENNPTEVRERGELVLELGLAPSTPREFIVLQLVQRAGGQLDTSVA